MIAIEGINAILELHKDPDHASGWLMATKDGWFGQIKFIYPGNGAKQ